MIRRIPPAKGFTLIETLVAIAIITIVMGAPFFAAVRSINATQNARDELTANMLAQEGIEYVVYKRDNNYLCHYNYQTGISPTDCTDWLQGLDGTGGPSCLSTNKCTVDPTTFSVVVCPGGVCSTLYLNTTTGLYTQQSSGNTKTRFTRWIQLTTLSANEVKVTSTVTWSTNKVPYTTTITEYLNNWL